MAQDSSKTRELSHSACAACCADSNAVIRKNSEIPKRTEFNRPASPRCGPGIMGFDADAVEPIDFLDASGRRHVDLGQLIAGSTSMPTKIMPCLVQGRTDRGADLAIAGLIESISPPPPTCSIVFTRRRHVFTTPIVAIHQDDAPLIALAHRVLQRWNIRGLRMGAAHSATLRFLTVRLDAEHAGAAAVDSGLTMMSRYSPRKAPSLQCPR